MKKEPTFIAFSTQKGGAGKTTLTVLMASYLYYVRGYDVVVVDCDFPQFSIKDMRERDMQSIESNEYLLRQTHEMMKRTGKPAYPIVESRPEEAVETVKPFLDMDTPPDFIFFDLAGTIDNLGVIDTIATMDYIFCPITADNVVLRSSIMFASQLNDMFVSVGKTNIKELNMLWNMVDAREKTDLYEKAGRVMDGLGLSVLDTFIPDSKRFRKECAEDGNKAVFRSTILPPDKQLIKGSNIEKLADEILSTSRSKVYGKESESKHRLGRVQKLIPTTHATKQGVNGRTYTKGYSKERSLQAERSNTFQGYFISHG